MNLQLQIITQVTEILEKYDSVVAAAIFGSHANGTNTAFSDIDLIVVFQNDERIGLKDIFDEIINMKPTLSTLYQLFDKESLILFDDGVRLDIKMEKRSDFDNEILDSAKVLFDKEDIFKQKNKELQIEISEKPRWNDEEGSFVDWFFWMFRQAYCYICQSEIVPAKSFEKRDLAISSIKTIRDTLLKSLYYVNGRRDYLANIDQNLLAKFSQTYQCNSQSEIKSSIQNLVELYEYIIGKYCEKEKLEFPVEKVTKIKRLFVEFDKLEIQLKNS